jgi:Fe2+ or Zn2+ uptake regulation protein
MDTAPQRLIDLRAFGGAHRWTRQRHAIVDVLRGGTTHLDASEIFEFARRHDPRLSLSTVYRTLAFLRDCGVVREVRLGEEHCHYELLTANPAVSGAAAKATHSHLVCRSCGLVVEFNTPLLDRLRRHLDRTHGFAVEHPEMELSGLCRSCRTDSPAPPKATAAAPSRRSAV